MNILAKLFKSTPVSKEQILNTGLTMAMEFGGNWRQPINDRLHKRFTYLSEQELHEYNVICRNAMDYGNEYIYNTLDKLFAAGSTTTNIELKERFAITMRMQYDWITDCNIRKLYSQGQYYAWKEGLDSVIV
jgi:hypothetical protein